MDSGRYQLTKALIVGIVAFIVVSYLTGGLFPFLEVLVAAGAVYFIARR